MSAAGGGLLAVALAGDAAAVRHALMAGADVHQRDAHGRTALHWAAATGLTAVLAALVEVGVPSPKPHLCLPGFFPTRVLSAARP